MVFKSLYIFGDSLSDSGNLFDFSNGLFPPAPYVGGRASNGPVWSEYFGNLLNLSPARIQTVFSGSEVLQGINFAIAGANTDDSNSNNNNPLKPANTPAIPGLSTQLAAYQSFVGLAGPSATDNPLHVLWAGANDYLGGDQTDPQVVLNNLGLALESLYSNGARTFLVANLPPLGDTPLGQSRAPGPLNALSDAHNRGLSLRLYQFEQSKPDARVILFDTQAVFEEVRNNPAAFGFTTTGGCFTLESLLANPPDPLALQTCGQTAVFWDDLHPTTKTHQLLADRAFRALQVDLAPALGSAAVIWNQLTGELFRLGAIAPVTPAVAPTPLSRIINDLNWQLQATGDLNGDGQRDVLLRHFGGAGHNLVLYLAQGGNSIQSEGLIGRTVEDPNWRLVGTGDLNGDGRTDIILQNQQADQIIAWYLDGQGNITQEAQVGRALGNSHWKIVATQDFNRDGQVDILLQNQAAGQIVLWEMNRSTILAESILGRSLDSNWSVEGGDDWDGNGTIDVLLRNTAAGQAVVWSMADKTLIGDEFLAANIPGATPFQVVV